MVSFDLKVGFTCNNFCLHCVVMDKKDIFKENSGHYDLSTKEIEEIIDTKIPKDATVNLTGGEATIRKDFEHIVNYLYERNFDITLQTNGTGLSDEGIVQRLGKKIRHTLIAIHSFEEDVHNKIVGDKTGIMYKKTMKALENLQKYGATFSTQTVISKHNVDSLFDTYKNIQKIAPGVNMHMTYPHLLGNAWKNVEQVAPKYSDIKPVITKCLKYYGEFLLTEAIPKCYLFPYQSKVSVNYDDFCFRRNESMGLDPSMPFSDNNGYIEDGIMTDYDAANFNDRLKGYKCKDCAFDKECPGVWKEYFDIYKNEIDLYPIQYDFGAIPFRSNEEDCENICSFCMGSKASDQDHSLEEFKQRADFFINEKRGFYEITGEPCQHKNIVEAVEYLGKNKRTKNIQISSHGRTFKDEDLVRRISEAGATHVRIPIYGSTREIHEKTAKSRNPSTSSFDEAIQGIKNCVKHGLIVCAHTLINNNNKDDLSNIYNLYHDLIGWDYSRIKEFVVGFTGISELSYNWTGDWFLPTKDYVPYIRKFISYVEGKVVQPYFIGIPHCVAGNYDSRFQNNQNIPDLGLANVNADQASEESCKIPQYQIRERFSECYNCDLIDICAGLTRNDLKLFGYYGLKAVKE